MSEQTCRHMREAVPTGACIVCHPEMFPSPEKLHDIDEWFRRRRQQQEILVELPPLPRPRTEHAKPVTPLPPPEPAPWQELEQSELTILYTLAILGSNPDFEGIALEQLRRELGTAWPEAEVQHALGQLRIKGYAGPYADGLWGIAGKGADVINDYKLRFARVS